MKNKKGILALTVLLALVVVTIPAIAFSADGDGNDLEINAQNFGGSSYDFYKSVTAASDGFVAVGHTYAFGNGDWAGVTGKGDIDATIVKYDNDDDVVWAKNFGGSGTDYFESVTAVSDGFVAVGYSSGNSFGNGDWAGVTGKGNVDAIVVKYDNNGDVVWAKNFGGSHDDRYYSVVAVSDGVVAVGYSSGNSFGNGDWAGVASKGNVDGIIVKYDNNGDVVWAKNSGDMKNNMYYSVTAVPGGVVAVGYSSQGSFGVGDWSGVTGKGSNDAIVVKYDNNGDVVWKKNFGGASAESFESVTAVPGGFVAVGQAYPDSFGSGDLASVTGKGDKDAIIVKYDNNGDVVWAKNFGGSGIDYFESVTAVPDGIVAVGYSQPESFGSGDLASVTGKGDKDAIIVKYDNNGDVVWAKNFGGSSEDHYFSVTAVPDSVVAVGFSSPGSFGNGDWAGVAGNGVQDAIVVKYSATILVPVTDITGVPSTATVGTPLTLAGTVVPSNATNQTIVWSVKDAGMTGASISGNVLSAAASGTVVVTATIANGSALGVNFTKDFTISVAGVVTIPIEGKWNFGGHGMDYYESVTTVSDGIVAVGRSSAFGSGDWADATGNGSYDAIIVKYDNNGDVVWKNNFGGPGNDSYYAVTAVSDGVIAVGHSDPGSFGSGDWAGVAGKGHTDAIIVKYDNNGDVVWAKNFGGSDSDYCNSVITVPGGFVAVGYSYGFGNGDWTGLTWKGGYDAFIVKFDNNGDVIWKNNFGGSGYDYYESVTAVSGGFVAVGYSDNSSFGNGDWTSVAGKGGVDAIIVKYDNNGDVVWAKSFGGSDNDYYYSVTTVSDGVIATGSSYPGSFGNGDWTNVAGKGSYDAFIVKYDNNGDVVWAKNFGGSGADYYYEVTAVSDGVVAVGYSQTLINGDWAGIGGIYNAIIVKYDDNGDVVWKENFGGVSRDEFLSVTAVSDGIVAVGFSSPGSFDSGDWTGIAGNGSLEAIIVKYATGG
ncbi:MAG: hypothetical protein FWH45_00050 [Methanomassiliicoccaceae archaeon]|nr:hypothetical protein [Methanomassiliicoccaceae archaeon]MCL2145566.1 hypothetical protein [Methanomassiliicoccaceae archaeon]